MSFTARQLFLAHQAQTSRFPLMLEVERAEGNYIYDVQGKRYLDLIAGISVSSLGHGNPHVKAAIHAQLEKHMHVMVYGEFIQSPQVKLASRLASLLPPQLQSVYLINSGAEAVDGALKLAKRVTGRQEIVACRNAYHGSTHAPLSLNSQEYYKEKFRPLLPGISFITFNTEDELSCITADTACVISEVIQGEAGYIPAQASFLKALRKRCDETGTLLIFDEIQSGMGRSGSLFAFEQYGIIPDVLLLGKALGAGMPIGAFISSKENMDLLSDAPMLGHISTFGGHPVIAAASLAGLDELLNSGLVQTVHEKEKLFRELLDHPRIRNINGKGLMLALELESFELNLALIQGCLAQGLITDWFLFANNCLRIAPPLTLTTSEIHWCCNLIVKELSKI
jgi:acetylornithine/N-succinyldiaminopimelate aminotransferase